MDADVILSKIEKAKSRIETAGNRDVDIAILSAMFHLADALEDIAMTLQANELKAARKLAEAESQSGFEDL